MDEWSKSTTVPFTTIPHKVAQLRVTSHARAYGVNSAVTGSNPVPEHSWGQGYSVNALYQLAVS